MIYISQHNSKECLQEFLRYIGRFDGYMWMGDGIIAQIDAHEARESFKNKYYSDDKRYWNREYQMKCQRHTDQQKLTDDMWKQMLINIETKGPIIRYPNGRLYIPD